MFPLMGWAMGLGLNVIRPKLGFQIMGGPHGLLAIFFLGMALSSALALRRAKSADATRI